MKFFSRVFTPTKNRRLNELAGFLLFVSAVLLFLALVSYFAHGPVSEYGCVPWVSIRHNWIGLFGAMLSDFSCKA